MIVKFCKKCDRDFLVNYSGERYSNGSYIWFDNQGRKGLGNICIDCKLHRQRIRRLESFNLDTKRYEKTKRGFIMRMYRNMKSRVTGVQKLKHHLYKGKKILDKKEFYQWALNQEEFHKLFKTYEESGYKMKLAPSVNRVDPSRGYTTDNMEFITHSENSKLGAYSKNYNITI